MKIAVISIIFFSLWIKYAAARVECVDHDIMAEVVGPDYITAKPAVKITVLEYSQKNLKQKNISVNGNVHGEAGE